MTQRRSLIPGGIVITLVILAVTFACVSPTTKAKVDTATKEHKEAKKTYAQASDKAEAATTQEEKDAAEKTLAEAKIALEEAAKKKTAAKLEADEEVSKKTTDWISFAQMLLLGALGAGGYRRS